MNVGSVDELHTLIINAVASVTYSDAGKHLVLNQVHLAYSNGDKWYSN
jgi:hypothetical protein